MLDAAAAIKAKPAELREKALQQMEELRQLRSALARFKEKEAGGEANSFLMGARTWVA